MIDPTSIPQYKPDEIEPKWHARWAADKLYETADHPDKQKFYALTMLPTFRGFGISGIGMP
jgi:Leucyl-tRNA synthetase